MEVLKSQSEIDQSRAELKRRGLSMLSPAWLASLRRFHIAAGLNVGDKLKSWDVLKTVKFLEENVSKQSPILELGAFCSENICILHRLGFSNLHAIDFNENLPAMPYSHSIRYQVGDFLESKFAAGSFKAITAISVIEHGFDASKLFSEVSRLLAPGGYFIASFDYWPAKIDTADSKLFGLSWTIFSADEVRQLISVAAEWGLSSPSPSLFETQSRVIRHAGKDYTFAWIALQKSGEVKS